MANYEKKVLISIAPYKNGYDLQDVYDETMTLGELREILKDYSDDAKVCLDLADGYYYATMDSGNITLTITNC